MKKLFSNIFASQFIIYGLLALLFYTLIPEEGHASVNILKNILNAIGSILLVGGIFEVAFKDKFIGEVSDNFVKTIFLDSNSLEHFKSKDLISMKRSIQERLLHGKNSEYSEKILRMINDSFFHMAQGNHKNNDFNKYFQYYNSVIYVNKKEPDSQKVTIEYEIKYEIVNNYTNEEGIITESEVDIFSKRFFPLSLSTEDNIITQELSSLKITKDNDYIDYKEEIRNGSFKEKTIGHEEQDSIKIQEDVKRQIKYKEDEDFRIKFKKSLIVEKKIKIITMYNDIGFYHTFKRPTINYSIQYHDENVSVKTKDYLTLRLFSGLNKKPNDKIHPVLKGKVISLHVSDGLLLPGEGICIVALRDNFMNQ